MARQGRFAAWHIAIVYRRPGSHTRDVKMAQRRKSPDFMPLCVEPLQLVMQKVCCPVLENHAPIHFVILDTNHKYDYMSFGLCYRATLL